MSASPSPEPQMLIVGGKRSGRPRASDPLQPVTARLPVATYDRLVKAASRRDQNVSELVRQILMAQSFLK